MAIMFLGLMYNRYVLLVTALTDMLDENMLLNLTLGTVLGQSQAMGYDV